MTGAEVEVLQQRRSVLVLRHIFDRFTQCLLSLGILVTAHVEPSQAGARLQVRRGLLDCRQILLLCPRLVSFFLQQRGQYQVSVGVLRVQRYRLVQLLLRRLSTSRVRSLDKRQRGVE
jgi:hypothetical protein